MREPNKFTVNSIIDLSANEWKLLDHIKFDVHLIRGLSANVQKPKKCDRLIDRQDHSYVLLQFSWCGTKLSIGHLFHFWYMYCQTSNISCTLVGNKLVDHSDVVGASPVGAAPNYNLILDLTPGFNGSDKDNCKTRWETFKFWVLVQLILELYDGLLGVSWLKAGSDAAQHVKNDLHVLIPQVNLLITLEKHKTQL